MINVLYEDNHILVVYKEAGLLSQGDISGDPNLLDMVKEYIKEKYNKPGNVYLGLVHRLDRNTSGIMVFARTSKAASRLSLDFKDHNLVKKYLAIVEGNLTNDNKLINYLSKDENKLMAYEDKKNGKLAKLTYHVVENKADLSLIDVTLESGRFHQIRFQLSNIGYPLAGDKKYGSKKECKIHLHSYNLSFNHPVTHELLNFTYYPKGNMWDKFNMNQFK